MNGEQFELRPLDSPHLVLYHVPNSLFENPETIETKLTKALASIMAQSMAFTLCFKGSPLAGFGSHTNLVRKMTDLYRPRVHFLSYAIPEDGVNGRAYSLFRAFEAHVQTASRALDWQRIDPRWPENLLAFYLVMVALREAPEDSVLEQHLHQSEELRQIAALAIEEYRGLSGLLVGDVEWMPPSRHNAKDVADLIWTTLKRRSF